jgi:hypothetical protein
MELSTQSTGQLVAAAETSGNKIEIEVMDVAMYRARTGEPDQEPFLAMSEQLRFNEWLLGSLNQDFDGDIRIHIEDEPCVEGGPKSPKMRVAIEFDKTDPEFAVKSHKIQAFQQALERAFEEAHKHERSFAMPFDVFHDTYVVPAMTRPPSPAPLQ